MGVDQHTPSYIHDLEATPEYNSSKALFKHFGWEQFFMKFQGFNDHVALVFA